RASAILDLRVTRFIVHVVIFGVLCLPWLVKAAHAFPTVSPKYPSRPWKADARLIAWVLAWVAHALRSSPSTLYDANIFYPAHRQLTGTEHLLSTQVVFAPAFWLSGNAVLATNVCLFFSYPLASFSMETLLRRVGLSRFPAFVAGLAFALGPLRVPANIQT